MKEYSEALEQAHIVAFTKFDQELVHALDTTETILSLHRDTLSIEQLCKAYLTISVCKIKMDTPDDIMPMLQEVEQYTKAEGIIPLMIKCQNLQANRLMRSGRFREAIQKLLNLLEIVQTPESKIINLLNLGLVYINGGMFDKALECLFENLRICEKTNNQKGYMRSCINIGICYSEIRSYEKSVEYFKAAQNIAADFPQDENSVSLAVYLGMAYANMSDFDNALELMQQAQANEKLFQYRKGKGSLVFNIGYVNLLKGDYPEALKCYTDALDLVHGTKNVLLRATILNSKARVHMKLGELQSAEEILQEALHITTTNNMDAHKQDCLQQLSLLYRALGDFEKAYEYLTEYQILYESLFSDKVKNSIFKYESDYLAEKSKQEAELFRLQYVELVEKNTIISEKQKQLEDTLALLSESNATKDKLISILAHDLRSPVSNLQMTLQMILSGKCSREDQNMMLSLLNEQTKFTFNLLDNLLWWAQSQRQGFILHPVTLPVNPLIDEIRDLYSSIAGSKEVGIRLSLEGNLIAIVDKDALALILRNLVGNALKYSPQNSEITISGHQAGKSIIIQIADKGEGIDSGILKAIENKSLITSKPGTSNEKGTGLGLSLCFEFVQKMQGKLSLCSDYSGGTCFSLELPTA